MTRLLLLLPLLLGSLPATAQQSGDAGAVLVAERAWVAAHDGMDADATATILADGFTLTHANGRVSTKQEILDGLASEDLGPLVIAPQRREDPVVRFDGDTATVTGIQVMDWKGSDVRSSYVDTYTRIDGRWRLISSRLTES